MNEINPSSDKECPYNATDMAELSHGETAEELPLEYRLYRMQVEANNGRGISSVKTLISCLRVGDKEGAEATARNEWDKIGSYPKIAQLLIDEKI